MTTAPASSEIPPELPSRNSGASKLLEALFDGREAFVEVRAIDAGKVVGREFYPAARGTDAYKRQTDTARYADVYFGVAPRAREQGTKDAIEAVPAVWVDADSPG